MTWSEVPSMEVDLGIITTKAPDFSGGVEPTESYSMEVDKGGGVFVFYVLSVGDIGFPTLTDEEVRAQGLDPDRSISGGGE